MPPTVLSWKFALLFVILFGSYTTQAVTGFGAAVISVTLGALIFPIDTLVAIVVPLNVVLTAFLVVRTHEHVDWKLFSRRIMPLMGAGLGTGILAAGYLKGQSLVVLLGVLVVLISLRELYFLFRAPSRERRTTALRTMPWIFAAGIVHGIYACGGPLLVYAVGKLNVGKAVFRSTLSVVWLTLNSLLTLHFIHGGRLNLETAQTALWLLPAIPLGVWLGDKLHHRVSEREFRIATFGLLTLAGGALVYKSLAF